MSGTGLDNYFEKRWFRIDNATLKIRHQQNVVGNDLVFGCSGLGLFLGEADGGNGRFAVDTARDPGWIESAFASQDGVNCDAGLRACGTVQETQSIDVPDGIKARSRKTHSLIHLKK